MKNGFKFTLLAMIASTTLSAQVVVQGKISDAETGKPIEAAHIRVAGIRNAGSISGPDGQFKLKLSSDSLELVISHVGYETDTLKMVKNNGEKQNSYLNMEFKMNPVFAKMSKEVVISSQRADNKSAMVFNEIDAEELNRNNTGRDIPFLLESIPSINITSDAGNGTGYTGLRIRGSDATRINVTIDGIPINDPESQQLYWVNMPDLASSVENIQVQRGAGTSSSGASSFGGGIHITTSRPSAEPFGGVSISAGSFNTCKATFRAGTGTLNGKWNFEARMSKISSDGYVDRASSNLKSYFLTGGYYDEKHSIRMNVFSGKEVTYQSWYGIPEAALDTNRTFNFYSYDNQVDDYQQDHYQLFHSWELRPSLELNTAIHYTYGRGFYEEYKFDQALTDYLLDNATIGNDTIFSTDLIRRKWLDNHFYGITTNLKYTPKERVNIQIGGGYNIYDGDHFGEVIWAKYASNGNIRHRYYDNNGLKKDLNLFAKSTWDISNSVSIYGDIQLRKIDYSFAGYDDLLREVPQKDELTFINPKFGITYTTAPGKFGYLSISGATKEPSRDDYTESSVNSRPKPERMYDLESGYHHTWRQVTARFNYFLMQYNDQLVLTGQINDVGNYTRTNVPESFREGLETEIYWRISDKFSMKANGSLSRSKIKEFREFVDDYDQGGQQLAVYYDTEIAFSPTVTAYGNLAYEPNNKLRFELVGRHTGKQYLDNTSNDNKSIDPYTVADIRLHWNPKIKSMKSFTLSLMAFNLLDELYESNGYTFGYITGGARVDENYYYPQAGRNFMIKADVRF